MKMSQDDPGAGITDLPEGLLRLAEEVSVGPGDCLTQQYHMAEYLYYLLSGELEFYISLGSQSEKLSVATADTRGTIIGWSGLRSPNRYATTVCSVNKCRLLRFSQYDVMAYFQQQPAIATAFLETVIKTGFYLLQQVRHLLTNNVKQPIKKLHYISPAIKTRFKVERDIVLPWLQTSAFFESFSKPSQELLLEKIVLQRCYSGETVLAAGETSDTLFILVNGSVNLYYEPANDRDDRGIIFLRSLASQGQVLNVQSIQERRRHKLTVIANQDSLFCCLALDDLQQCAENHSDFALELQYALLSLLGNQLRSSRAQLVNQVYDDEVFNIRGILKQAAPQLPVTSSLHKVPHLLESRLTHGDAFRCLELAQARGSALEKNLGGLCLDVLQETKSEWKFYQSLNHVYQSVIDFPADTDPSQVRKHNAALFRDAFAHVRYRIEGQENLPARAGHIFILNHLVSHPYHLLPNHFELSLDTNFVSAMILDPKYGDSGMRVVRKGRSDEYAHHNYYSRLDYINVITDESDQMPTSRADQSQAMRFVNEAKKHLQQGMNIVICPEGRSLWSDESPGLFKSGAFLLATSVEPEPYIVPVAMANFDKRLHNKRLAALIKQPFRISEQVDVTDKQALKTFLEQYQLVYRGYVEEAQQLAMSN